MKDILINGISINALKEQRKAIQQGASKIISDSIEQGTEVVKELMKAESPEQAEELAAKALELFETAEVVSGVSGVTFEIPYYEEYGSEFEGVMSYALQQEDMAEDDYNVNLEYRYDDGSKLAKLVSLLESMESDSEGWHSSRC